jgi:hypothetical protein
MRPPESPGSGGDPADRAYSPARDWADPRRARPRGGVRKLVVRVRVVGAPIDFTPQGQVMTEG